MAVKFLFAGNDPRIRRHSIRGRETRALQRLEHPHVVGFVDANMDAAPPYIVAEFVEGTTLSHLLGARNFVGEPLELSTVAQLAIQAGEACLHAHEHGVIHRDLKPQNVIVVKRAQLSTPTKNRSRASSMATRDGGSTSTSSKRALESPKPIFEPWLSESDAGH